MAILATKTSADKVASADINTLSSRAVDKNTLTAKGDIYAATASGVIARLGVGADGKALVAASGETTGLKWDTVSSSKPDYVLQIPAGAWDRPAANYAEFEKDTLTNGTIGRERFDDTTEEFVESIFTVPSDVNASGTVTFIACGYAVTAAASKNIELTFYHSAKADSESIDAAYSSKISGDLACDATQDDLDIFSWTETIANLGWAAGDQVRIKLSRTAPSADNLTGDWGLTIFEMRIPRS